MDRRPRAVVFHRISFLAIATVLVAAYTTVTLTGVSGAGSNGAVCSANTGSTGCATNSGQTVWCAPVITGTTRRCGGWLAQCNGNAGCDTSITLCTGFTGSNGSGRCRNLIGGVCTSDDHCGTAGCGTNQRCGGIRATCNLANPGGKCGSGLMCWRSATTTILVGSCLRDMGGTCDTSNDCGSVKDSSGVVRELWCGTTSQPVCGGRGAQCDVTAACDAGLQCVAQKCAVPVVPPPTSTPTPTPTPGAGAGSGTTDIPTGPPEPEPELQPYADEGEDAGNSLGIGAIGGIIGAIVFAVGGLLVYAWMKDKLNGCFSCGKKAAVADSTASPA